MKAVTKLDGVAPGIDAQVSGGSGLLTTGRLLATLRLVPLRAPNFAFFLVGRGGRVFVADHEDGWAAGGGGGVILFTGARVGVMVSYDVLRLFPRTFCADQCTSQGLSGGLVAGF